MFCIPLYVTFINYYYSNELVYMRTTVWLQHGMVWDIYIY